METPRALFRFPPMRDHGLPVYLQSVILSPTGEGSAPPLQHSALTNYFVNIEYSDKIFEEAGREKGIEGSGADPSPSAQDDTLTLPRTIA